MTPREVHGRLASASPAPLLLDVREPWEYGIVHLPDSKLIPMHELPLKLLDLDPARETVIICHLGIRSRVAAHFLEQQGFTNVINLLGGIEAWAVDVDRSLPRY